MKIFSKTKQPSALEVTHSWDDNLLSDFLRGARARDHRNPDQKSVEHTVILSGARTSLTSDANEFNNELVLYGHFPLFRSDRETNIERNSTYLQVVVEIHSADVKNQGYLGGVYMGNHGTHDPFATMYVNLQLNANQRNDFEKSLGLLRAENQMPRLILRLNVDNTSETSSGKNSSFTIARFWLESLTVFNKEWLSKNLVFKKECS